MIAALAVIALAVIVTVGITSIRRDDRPESWHPEVEGFLAVATPCCTRASLWEALDTITPDGQRARPASAAEAAQWLNEWPYRSRKDPGSSDDAQLGVALQSSEVRCTGAPAGAEIPRRDGDEETLEAIRHRRECVYAKWKVWSEETASERPNERHIVWADDDGFFHGRVDYWQKPPFFGFSFGNR